MFEFLVGSLTFYVDYLTIVCVVDCLLYLVLTPSDFDLVHLLFVVTTTISSGCSSVF